MCVLFCSLTQHNFSIKVSWIGSSLETPHCLPVTLCAPLTVGFFLGSVGPYSPASHRMPTPSPVARQGDCPLEPVKTFLFETRLQT